MTARRYNPKRSLRSEVVPLALVLFVPVALYIAFPPGAVGFSGSDIRRETASDSCFITLPAERESRLLASARVPWQTDAASRRGIRANLLNCRFSGSSLKVAAGLRPVSGFQTDSVTDYELDIVPAGVGADAPAVLPAERPAERVPAFRKSDLLKLN